MDTDGKPLVEGVLYEISGGNIKTPRFTKYTGTYDESGTIFYIFEDEGGFTQKELTSGVPHKIVKVAKGGRRKRRTTRRSKKTRRTRRR